jgi:hypothetical protein
MSTSGRLTSCRVTILEMRLLPRESSRLYALVRLGPASAPRQRGCWKRHRARPSRVFSIHMDCGPCFDEENWSSCRDACDRRLLPITLRRAPTTNRRPPCGVASTKLPTSCAGSLRVSRREVCAGAWRASRRPTRFRFPCPPFASACSAVAGSIRVSSDDLVVEPRANRRVAPRWEAAFRDGLGFDRASMATRPS